MTRHKTTEAQNISWEFNHDNQRFETREGLDIRTMCEESAIEVTRRDEDCARYWFEDGSSLVVDYEGWDFPAKDCEAFCWLDIGCRCEDKTVCIYCDLTVTDSVPEVHDDESWKALQEEHTDECEWALTRAHRKTNDPDEPWRDIISDSCG